MKLETAIMDYPFAFVWGMIFGAVAAMIALLTMLLLPYCQ
jgi:hypothetical protein